MFPSLFCLFLIALCLKSSLAGVLKEENNTFVEILGDGVKLV